MSKTYKEAVELLRSRIRLRNPKRLIKNHPNNLNMREWLSELGYESTSDLNVIHVTGTKGKGSTAALADSLLRTHFRHCSRPITVGLYTSPHLITERERIRINFHALSEDLFAKYFFEVWDTLRKNVDDDNHMPGYLQLLALLSVHAFKKEVVDVAIYEVHAGGRKDATNIFEQPIACGFTTIGLDHADLLGGTIRSITCHKSGIMKRGSPAFSVFQEEPMAKQVLEVEAKKVDCPLKFVGIHGELPNHPKLRLPAQKQNASLAIRLANAYLDRENDKLSARDIVVGTGECNWPGRFQRIQQGTNQWFLDAAHNDLSLPVALTWFESEVQSSELSQHGSDCKRVLIFGHESGRNTCDLITTITQFCKEHTLVFDSVLLSPYERYGLKVYESTTEEHAKFWRAAQPSIDVSCTSSVKDAVTKVEQKYPLGCRTLVTGSTHLVGETLAYLQDKER